MTKKDQERENEIKHFKAQSHLVAKDIQTKHDQITRDLQEKLDEARENLLDTQSNLDSIE